MEKLITNAGAFIASLIIGVVSISVTAAQGRQNSVALGTELFNVDGGDATGYVAVSQVKPGTVRWGVKVAGLLGGTRYGVYSHACDGDALVGEFETDTAGAALAAFTSTGDIASNQVQICEQLSLVLYGELNTVEHITHHKIASSIP